MNVAILGAHGYLGPHVIAALAPRHHLRITDIKPAPANTRQQYAGHEFMDVDITSAEQVLRAARGMDAIINLAVVRTHPVLAFRVNALGCYHMMQAAIASGIRRVINTGPHFTVAGPNYEGFDHQIGPDVPPHPGTNLYALTKSLGHQICMAMAEDHDVYVQEYLFYSFRDAAELKPGAGGVPFAVSWSDAAEVFRLGLEIELTKLPSRCEVFFVSGDAPHGKFLNGKAKRILGFAPKDDVSALWRRP